MAGLTETKTKPNSKLKLELKFGAELCNKRPDSHLNSALPRLEKIWYNYEGICKYENENFLVLRSSRLF